MSQEVIQLAVTLFKSRHELYLAFETNVKFISLALSQLLLLYRKLSMRKQLYRLSKNRVLLFSGVN